jgi:hypothetical protein
LRRDNAGEESADSKRDDGSTKDERVPALDLIKLSGDQAGASNRSRDADKESQQDLQKGSPQNQSNHAAAVCAEGHPHADLVGTTLDGIRSHSIQSNCSQYQCEDAEESGMTEWISEKMAVVAPIPRAMVSIAVRVKTGDNRICLRA